MIAGQSVPDDDRGLLLGDGLFETILAEAGRLDQFEPHLDRMRRGCGTLGLAAPNLEAARAAALSALDKAGLADASAVVRLTLTAGSGRGLDRPPDAEVRLIATASPAPRALGPARLATVAIRRNETSPTSRLKTLAYLDNVLARRQARETGADEAVMLNTRGDVACAAAANLFWIAGERLFTPALECGVLGGIMRGRVLAAAAALGVEALEVRQGAQALAEAEAVVLTNSLIGIRAAAMLDGRALSGHRLIDALSSRCR